MSRADQNSGSKAMPHRPVLWWSHADTHSHLPPALIQISLFRISFDFAEYRGDISQDLQSKIITVQIDGKWYGRNANNGTNYLGSKQMVGIFPCPRCDSRVRFSEPSAQRTPKSPRINESEKVLVSALALFSSMRALLGFAPRTRA